MSGGKFNYPQHTIDNISDDVKSLADRYSGDCSKKTLERIKRTADVLELAGKMLARVDYFASGDDGEESFNKRWDEEKLDEWL